MSEKRRRDKSLTIRLTQSEKELIVNRAKEKRLTVADFLIQSILSYNDERYYTELCESLTEIKRSIVKLKDNADKTAIQDSLDMQQAAYSELMKAICHL